MMGFAAVSLDCDVKKSDSRKEENQERAFVAASRRKDRTLDARLESANRASMLHKKRTGKALLITKDIVENEAMYEEIDERYQEKRMKLLKDQTNQLEAQFHRHLVATLAISHPNGTHQMSRISPTGGIQKVRGMSPAQSYFAQQAVAPMSPLKPDPASATFGTFALPSPPAESYVQTHQPYASYMSAQVPMYMSTPQLNPSWNTTSADAIQSFLATQQPINSQEISQPPPFRSRFASVPDVLLYQQQQNMALAMPDASRAQSEPHQSVLETNEGQMASAFTNFALTPDLSPPPMTSNSSQDSSGGSMSPQMYGLSEQVHLGVSDISDPDIHEFFDFATNVENQWQGAVDPCEEWPHVDSLEFELAISGI